MIRLRFEVSVIHVLLTLAGLNKLIKIGSYPCIMCSPSKAKPSADAPSWAIARPHRRESDATSVSFTEPLHSSTPAACSAGPSRDVADQISNFLQSSSLSSSQLCAPVLVDSTE